MGAESEVRGRVAERGAITFAEFMETALFWPGGGYYSKGGAGDARQDYYTSPQVHPAFGALLAVQVYQMWDLLERPGPFWVVELGAGNGLLGQDFTGAARRLPGGFGESLRYVCVDRRAAAAGTPAPPEVRTPGRPDTVVAAGVPFRQVQGCLLSNELLDSFAVHQVRMGPEGLREVYVTLEAGELAATLGEPSTPALASRLADLGIELAEGQTAEINLGLEGWASGVAASIARGFVLTIDYGHLAPELYSAECRGRGALTTFYRHTQLDAPFRHVGRQDITAQVDFTSVMSAGHGSGLDVLGLATQAAFLQRLGLGRLQRRLAGLGLPQEAADANRAGMLDLARRGGLGDFKVLVQGKGVGTPRLWGLEPSSESPTPAEALDLPLLTSGHLWLTRGRYPGGEVEFEPEWWGEAR